MNTRNEKNRISARIYSRHLLGTYRNIRKIHGRMRRICYHDQFLTCIFRISDHAGSVPCKMQTSRSADRMEAAVKLCITWSPLSRCL